MPAKSKAQQRLMAAAAHGATFPKARALRRSMTPSQLHDFASGSEAQKPDHVPSRMRPAPRPGGNRYHGLAKRGRSR